MNDHTAASTCTLHLGQCCTTEPSESRIVPARCTKWIAVEAVNFKQPVKHVNFATEMVLSLSARVELIGLVAVVVDGSTIWDAFAGVVLLLRLKVASRDAKIN